MRGRGIPLKALPKASEAAELLEVLAAGRHGGRAMNGGSGRNHLGTSLQKPPPADADEIEEAVDLEMQENVATNLLKTSPGMSKERPGENIRPP